MEYLEYFAFRALLFGLRLIMINSDLMPLNIFLFGRTNQHN